MSSDKLELEPENIIPIVFNSLNTDFKAFFDAFVLEKGYQGIEYLVNKSVDLMGPDLIADIGGRSILFDYIPYVISMDGYISNLRWLVDEKPSTPAWRKGFTIVPSHDVIARFLLYQASINFDTSLLSIFGRSSTGGPSNRVKLLEAVVEDGADCIKDLSDYLDLSSNTVRKKLRSLARSGIVDLETRGAEVKKGDLRFRVSSDSSKIIEQCGTQNSFYRW